MYIILISICLLSFLGFITIFKNTPQPKPILEIFKFSLTEVFFNHSYIKGTIIMQNYKDTQVQGKVSIGDFGAPADAAGNETTVVAGSVVFKSSNEAVLTVVAEIAKSEYAFRATFTGKAGSADVIITANPDINSDGGLLEITGLTTYVVSTDEATSFKQPTVGDLQPA